MGVLLHESPIEDKHGCVHNSCYASIRGVFSVVRKQKFGSNYVLLANMIVYAHEDARRTGKEQLESVQVAAPLPASFEEDWVIEQPFTLLYSEIKKQFPNCEDC